MRRKLLAVCLVGALAGILGGCGSGSGNGGGGGGGRVANTATITVFKGPTGNAVDIPFSDVQICVPGTSNCQTVTNVSVDTGSSGLRVLSSQLNLPLPQENATGGSPLVECAQFVSFITWGSVRMADIKMAGEVAANVPIQLIADPAFAAIPPACSSAAPATAQTQAALGANGILGVGLFRQDCGPACAPGTVNNPDFYYQCPTPSTCSATTASATQQLQNPVWMFSNDNNGVLIQLPQIPAGGAPSTQGSLIFGIGTQSNNQLGSATVFTVQPNGTFTTIYNGTPYPMSFIDSGSNGIFFLTHTITGIPVCSTSTGFYCPASIQNLSATNQGANGANKVVNFSITNADTLSGLNFAFNDIGGENAGPPPSFDWGLPFFFGRNVFTGIEGQSSPAGTNGIPYWAY